MPISAQMTLWGMMEYDPTILDGLNVPTGMDASTVKDNLLMETASMEILYPSVPFLKAAIKVWSDERQDVWQKLYETTLLDYNPIENYDRIEETNRSASGMSKSRSSSSSSNQSSGKTEATASNTAYNSATFADTAKNQSEGSNQTSTSNIESGSANSSANELVHSRIHGNIGVTSSQQLIEAEREVDKFCMTEFIINDFITRFCIGVY